MTADSITYDLTRKPRYATTIFTGLFVGGTIALAGGESLAHQLILTAVIATIASGGSHWALCRLTAAVTEGTGSYRIVYPTHESATRVERTHGASGRDASDESTPVGPR
ncbi:hypothetical protein [Natronorubrum thiooxidans]|uniref:Uncharacterized protein n=1 Tax=Natronorubrum thiooxidans TaxID=308853 RepID=A0A1N7H5B3_9EURY|nr:hypothetical protein [Natronorubrum thiooxidans]SIS19890.1 hypothetical protein SAMN05421752_12514 [Natronorubrum thiooxidans]